MTKPIGWGILGAGAAARDFARGLRSVPGAKLVAVASRSAPRADEFARRFAAQAAYASAEQLIAAPGVDVVYVATPNNMHRSHCLLALESGKHVLCEKPFALTAREGREVIATARRRRLFCMEAMWTRFLPATTKLKALVDEGTIGPVRCMTADLGFAAPFDPKNRFFDPKLGGGALLDLGVYLVSLASLLLGPPERTIGRAVFGPTGVDEHATAILEYADGAVAVLTASIGSDLAGECTVIGTRGKLRVHPPLIRPHRLSWERRPERRPDDRGTSGFLAGLKENRVVRSAYYRLEGLLGQLRRGPADTVVAPFVGNGYGYEAAEVMRCLAAGETESPALPLDETLAVLDVLDELRSQWSPPPAGFRRPVIETA